MNFEDILKDVGAFGLYQKVLTVSLLPCFIILPWFSMSTTFMSTIPDHWCHVQDVAISNLSFNMKMQLTRPPKDPSCSIYDVNYSQILKSSNFKVDTEWPTNACTEGYEFDHTDFDATASTYWNMVCENAHYSSLLVSSTFIGQLMGTPFFGFLADKLGRKSTFLTIVCLLAVTDIGSVLSPYFGMFICLRVLYGTAICSLYGALLLLGMEAVSPNMRPAINGLASTAWSLGLCLFPLVVWLTRDWVLLSTVTSSAAASLTLLGLFVSESPSWLISQERYKEATEILKRIGKINGKTDLETLQLSTKIQMLGHKMKKEEKDQTKYSPLDFFRYPKLRRRILVGIVCYVGNIIPYYGLQINVQNLSGNIFLNFFYVSLVEVPAHLAAWISVKRLGTRWSFVFSFAISTISCLTPVLIPSEDGMVEIIASILGKAGTSATFMVVIQVGTEILPTPLRGMGTSVVSAVGFGSALTAPFITYMSKYDRNIPFLVFAILTLIGGLFSSFLPETLNMRLPQTVEDVENSQDPCGFFFCRGKYGTEEKLEENIGPHKISSIADQ